MKLLHAHIENFGTLRNFDLAFSDGLNAYPMENGSGKSTLIAFLKCMLYGLSDSRSHDLSENERKHFSPWQGGVFGGSLIIEHKEKVYRIVRRFGTRPSEDILDVYEEDTGARTDVLGRIPGQTIFSMDAEGFTQCAVFSERGYSSQLTNESVLARMGEEQDAKGAAPALALLAEERRQYERKGGRGLLAETDDTLLHAEEKLATLQKEANTLPQKEQAYLEAKAALSAMAGKAIPTDTVHAHYTRFYFYIAAFLASTSLIGGVFSPFSLLGLFPAILLCSFGVFSVFANKHSQNGLNSKNNPRTIAETSKAIVDEFEIKYHACADCERAYTAAKEAAEEAILLEEKITLLKKKRERIISYLSDIKKAEEYLVLAARNYSEKRAAATHAYFEEYLHALGVADGHAYRLGDRFRIAFLETDTYRDGNTLSRGGKDLVSLARSLALLSALPCADGVPLLLDDPFIAYDDTRLATALSALEALAKERQILYLTCSHSRMP